MVSPIRKVDRTLLHCFWRIALQPLQGCRRLHDAACTELQRNANAKLETIRKVMIQQKRRLDELEDLVSAGGNASSQEKMKSPSHTREAASDAKKKAKWEIVDLCDSVDEQ